MNFLTFDDFMGLSVTVFKKFAWKSTSKSIWRPIYFWTSMFILFLYMIFFCVFKSDDDENNLIFLSVSRDIASIAVQGSFFTKTFSLLFQNCNKIKKCFKKLENLFPKKLEDQKKYNVFAEHKTVSFKNKFILIFYTWNTTISSLAPLIVTLHRYFFGDGIYELTFNIYFRFNCIFDYFLVKEFVLVILLWNNVFCCAVAIAVDVIYISILSALCMQFKIFTQQISEVNFKLSETKNKMANMIEHHAELIKLSDLVDEIFSPTILINLVNGAVILCILGFETLVRVCLFQSRT